MEIIFTLIGINILVFLMPYILEIFGIRISNESFLAKGWANEDTFSDGEYYRLLTATFLHGDIFHLAFNMYYLFSFGGDFVTNFSPQWFIITYIISGIIGSVFSVIFNKRPSVGASGSLFGLI